MTTSFSVAVLISSQHFIDHGGIGQFAKMIKEIADELDWRVQFYLDRSPGPNASNLKSCIESTSLRFPANPRSYRSHGEIHFYKDSINWEKVINYRQSLFGGLRANYFDAIICNDIEALLACYALGPHSFISTIFYTHFEGLFYSDFSNGSVFTKSYNKIAEALIELPDLLIATQSDRNKFELSGKVEADRISVLPIRVPERGLLRDPPRASEKSGVLFIGRHEARKGPYKFAKVLGQCGLPAKVLTGGRLAEKKWHETFAKHGVVDYSICVDKVGSVKVDFIRSARLAYLPSAQESFGLGAFECLHSCPTFLPLSASWAANFDDLPFRCTANNAAEKIKRAYYDTELIDRYCCDATAKLRIIDQAATDAWSECAARIAAPSTLTSGNRTDSLSKHVQTAINSLERHPSIEDVESAYRKAGLRELG